MKKLFIIASVIAVLAACEQVRTADPVVCDGMAEFTVNVQVDGVPVTRGSSTTDVTYEKQLNSVQVAVFDGTALAGYQTVTGTSATFSLRTGKTYTAAVVANGPTISGKTTLSAVESTATALGTHNSTTASTGMVMYGKNTMSSALTSAGGSVSVAISRLVCRVNLVSVTVTPPTGVTAGDNYKFTNAFLSNVATNCSLSGTVTLNSSDGNYSNWFGRATLGTKTSIIDGSTGKKAFPETLTYSTSSTAKFYSYANSNTDAVTAYKTSWEATATRLVVTAKWNGTTYYYPVPIPQTQANYTYDVKMTITGPGIDDPQGPIPSKANLNVTITVNPWTAGSEYNVTY